MGHILWVASDQMPGDQETQAWAQPTPRVSLTEAVIPRTELRVWVPQPRDVGSPRSPRWLLPPGVALRLHGVIHTQHPSTAPVHSPRSVNVPAAMAVP